MAGAGQAYASSLACGFADAEDVPGDVFRNAVVALGSCGVVGGGVAARTAGPPGLDGLDESVDFG